MSERSLVVVAGANGYLGRSIRVRHPSRYEYIGVVREPAKVSDGPVAEMLRLTELDSLSRKRHVSCVLHFMGRSRIRKVNDLYTDNVETTKILAKFCATRGARLVYISGYGVTGSSTSVYYRCKAAA